MQITVSEEDLRGIGPFEGEEVRAALKRVFNHPATVELSSFLFPTWSEGKVREKYDSVHTVTDFQDIVIAAAIKSVLAQTSRGVTVSGTESLDPSRRHLFISNHRDIVMDPALFVSELRARGFETPNVALGDNLLVTDWITDLVKLNKSIIVRRNISRRELFRASHVLSAFICRQIQTGRDSVWLAQREGRAKDGNDRTQAALIKMLCLSREGGILDHLKSLHIVPVSISYEYDPCDLLKARELYQRQTTGSYEKGADEDVISILTGIKGKKGRIHIAIGTEISEELGSVSGDSPKDVQIKTATEIIDRQVLSLYRLWPSNYIAADLLDGGELRSAHYTPEEREKFLTRTEDRVQQVPEAARDGIRRILLGMYANPVRNAESAGTTGA